MCFNCVRSDSQAEILTYHGPVYNVNYYFFNSLSQHFTNDFKICIFKVYWKIARLKCSVFTCFKEEANVCTCTHGRREHGSILNFNEVSVLDTGTSIGQNLL